MLLVFNSNTFRLQPCGWLWNSQETQLFLLKSTFLQHFGNYISKLIRYSIVFGSYQDVLDRGLLLTRKLLNQGFLLVNVKSSLRTLYGRHHHLVNSFQRYVPFFVVILLWLFLLSWHSYHMLNQNNRTSDTSGKGTWRPLGAPCLTRITRRVTPVERELDNRSEHLV